MATLTDATKEYSNETFRHQDYDEAAFGGLLIEGCAFVACRFSGTMFRGCTFRDVTFRDCDLNQTALTDSLFRGVTFEQSRVIGVNWSLALWDTLGLPASIRFSAGCVVNYTTFFGLTLPELQLAECVVRHSDFGEATLTRADFHGSDLTESTFHHTDLTGADFRGATGYAISPANNTLSGAKFSLPEAVALLYSMDIELDEGEDT